MKQKLDYISLMRVCAMLMVLLYHSMAYYSLSVAWPFHGTPVQSFNVLARTLNAIDMPIFVIISVFLFSYSNENHRKKTSVIIFNKARRLIVPYLLWGLLQLFLFPNYCEIGTFLKGMLHLWFLLMLFNVFFISIITRKVWESLDIHIFICLLFGLYVFGEIIPIYIKENLLCVKQTLIFLPFFFTGVFLHKWGKVLHDKYNMGWKIVAIQLFLFVVIVFSCNLKLSDGGRFLSLGNKIACALFVSNLIIYLQKREISFNGQVIGTLDRNSMGIYILHHIIIWYMLISISFIDVIKDKILLTFVLLLLCSGIISLLMSVILNKSPYTRWIFG